MLLLATLAVTAAAQQPTPVVPTAGARPTYTTTSVEARQALADGLDDLAYIDIARAVRRFRQAVALDSSFGLARVLHAAFAPGLDSAQRMAEATRGMSDAARASTRELLLATALREQIAERRDESAKLFRAAADLYPDDALFAMLAAQNPSGQRAPAATVEAFRAVTTRFPSFGAPYNGLAYALLNVGDTTAALEAARKQVELAPGQPNPLDSYAEMLQVAGRLDSAARYYADAARADSGFTEAYVGMAELHQLRGRTADARAGLATALRLAAGIEDSLRYMTYLAQNRVYANDLREAGRQLGAVAQLAEQRRQMGAAAEAHGNLAVLAALSNDRAGVSQHLEHLRRLRRPADSAQVARTAGLAWLTAGMTDSLRAVVATLPADAHLARAALATLEKKGEDAQRALEAARNDGPLARELLAEAHALQQHADVARATRQQLHGLRFGVYYNDTDLATAVALRRAGK
ncbi:hypothetical protein rosag_23260 [Roseisolibacter agri]|uniref:Tetratricopeptide repeat protein n=1 Tax=Roseisolibacter agri TaxID=2014610 RepID=A0AA37VAV3_9BACT|nr:hypothetical protein rosag_23260 [Roseisolibacter agri]